MPISRYVDARSPQKPGPGKCIKRSLQVTLTERGAVRGGENGQNGDFDAQYGAGPASHFAQTAFDRILVRSRPRETPHNMSTR
ncbi:MAG: hypothetical protein OXH03_02260 [Bacteroidetes bacterium]|nr:hypothetical protein [Bacteroidota bacterium]MXW84361.1 hypothetical protein [Rhodothermaceae bacterium]MDE2673145.1 hypothetical protein [Bacteroidota bacterium]MXX57404.1 hypothetical protein [Rhodothermaceae bacterium]MYD19368.1 hypothetical protein [Rhodothermaceae bacterium]